MEKPRPSPNFGKCTSTRATCARRSATAAGSSVGSRRTTSPSGDGELSVTTRRCLINAAIDVFLEGCDADAVHHLDEALGLAVAVREIALDQPLDDTGHLRARDGWADDFAERRLRTARPDLALVAADLDLVPLLAVLIDAEDADVADMVVAAGVHATRDVEVELADVVQVVKRVALFFHHALDRFRHGNRLGVGERAEVAAGAADDVGEKAEVGRVEAEQAHFMPKRHELVLAHVGEHQVLLVRDAQLSERITLGEIGDAFHLVARDVAWRHAGFLKRQRDGGVAGNLVRMDVSLRPGAEGGLPGQGPIAE